MRILILEDNTADSEITKRVLRKGGLAFTSIVVDAKSDFVRALDEFKPTVILADHALTAFDSTAALEIVLERSLDIPFILVTGTVSDEFAAQAVRQGADDYL